jgi:hypothetical protein
MIGLSKIVIFICLKKQKQHSYNLNIITLKQFFLC